METRWVKFKRKFKRKLLRKIFLRVKKEYRETFSTDMCCPNCMDWFAISGIEHKHEYLYPEPDFGCKVKCGKCKHESYWNLADAPVPLLCDVDGTPLPQ